MSNVIPFPFKNKEHYYIDEGELVNTDFGYINDDIVKKPTNTREYLELCKSYLNQEDYEFVLCAIMDLEYYRSIEKPLKGVVDAYYSYLKT